MKVRKGTPAQGVFGATLGIFIGFAAVALFGPTASRFQEVMGALGGFVIPPVPGFAVRSLGKDGYAIGFIVFLFLALFSLSMAWILKDTHETGRSAQSPADALPSTVAPR